MIKTNEASNPNSCWNRANPYEYVFVLLGRDEAAPATIRFWVQERVRLRKNLQNDHQIKEALRTAKSIEYFLDNKSPKSGRIPDAKPLTDRTKKAIEILGNYFNLGQDGHQVIQFLETEILPYLEQQCQTSDSQSKSTQDPMTDSTSAKTTEGGK